MSNKLIFCQPETLVATVSSCNLQVDIAEAQVCDLLIGASYELYVNGILDPGSPFIADINGKLFPGGYTITRTQPITKLKLKFPCDDCHECDIEQDLPAVSNCFQCTGADINLSLSGGCAGITVSGTVMDFTNPLLPVSGCSVAIYLGGNLYTTSVTDAFGAYAANIPVAANGSYTVKVKNCLGCERSASITVSDCCDAALNGVSYNCATQSITSTLASCPGPLGYNILQNNVIVFSGLYLPTIVLPFALVNGNYTLRVDCGGGCLASKDFSVSCGLPDFTFSNTCVGLIGQITINAFSGGSGAPYLFEYSTDNFSSILGSSAVAPFTFNTTAGTTYQMRVKDSAGNASAVKIATGLDCSINSFDFTTLMKCVAGVQKFCITPTISGVFTAVVKDFNNVTVFSGPISGTANVEVCTNFTTPPAAGIGSIDLTYNGNTVTKQITIAACAVAAISYDCVTGLSVTGVTNFMVHSSGYPSGGYGPFASGTPNLFFTDDLSGSRVLTIKSLDGSETYGTVTINCCVHDIVTQHDNCAGLSAFMKIVLTGISGTYTVELHDGVSNPCAPQTILHAGGTVIYPIACPLLSNKTYTVQVENQTYGVRSYVDQLIGNTTCIVSKSYTTTNCGGTGGGGGTGDCNLTLGDFAISGGCNPLITNNSTKTVSLYFYSTENTDCTGHGFIEGSAITINPGQTVGYGTLGHPNLGKKVFVNYTGGSGDPCTLTFCYAGCTGVTSCSLTSNPVVSCTSNPFGGLKTIHVLNNNVQGVFWYANGQPKGFLAGGASGSASPYSTSQTVFVEFRCVDDITETTFTNYTVTC